MSLHLVCPQCGAKNRVAEANLDKQVLCGKCQTDLMAAAPVALDDDRFQTFVSGTELPVVVDFWAPWCGPCQMMAPQFERAAQAMPRVRFAKVNSDEAGATSQALGIRSIPTLVLFQRGRELARISGALGAADLQRWIAAQLGSAA